MKITILGSTGFVGKVLIKKAIAAGYQVKTLARNPEKLEEIKDKIEIITGNVFESSSTEAAIEGAEVVISTIGPPQRNPGDPVQYEKALKNIDRIIEKLSIKFYSTLVKKEYPNPTLFKLMVFRMSRTSVRLLLDESWRDYTYYKNNGWFGSAYYYPIQLNPITKLVGNFFDFMFTRIYGKKVRTNQVLSD